MFTGTCLTDPEVLRAQEVPLARMIAQGFSLKDVVRGYSLVYSFVAGFCIEEQAAGPRSLVTQMRGSPISLAC